MRGLQHACMNGASTQRQREWGPQGPGRDRELASQGCGGLVWEDEKVLEMVVAGWLDVHQCPKTIHLNTV